MWLHHTAAPLEEIRNSSGQIKNGDTEFLQEACKGESHDKKKTKALCLVLKKVVEKILKK